MNVFAASGLLPPWDLAAYWWLPPAALVLDLLLGDPPGFPHPVRYIGACLETLEHRLRPLLPPYPAGLAGLSLALLATGIVTTGLLLLPFGVGSIAALYLCYAGLALGQLLREGEVARRLLEGENLAPPGGCRPAEDGLQEARAAVGRLVSRDVSRADREELRRVLAETLGENVNDGFIAPLFWLMLGGPLGLWLYKAVSTMDSMWGYPHEPWTLFGRPAARLDDAAAFIPARLSVLFLYLGALPQGLRRNWPGFAVVARDARSMKSPNAGWPMAAAAKGAAWAGRRCTTEQWWKNPFWGRRGDRGTQPPWPL